MSPKAWAWLAVVLVLAAVLWWNPGDVVTGAGAAVADFLTRGQRLTDGPVDADPEELRAIAAETLGRDVELDDYAGARMLRSEADDKVAASSARAKILRAHVAYNDAAAHGWSIYQTVTYGGEGFAAQSGRRYSTARDPYENDLLIMESVRASRDAGGPDEAAGATKFLNTRGGFAIPSSWIAEGYRAVAIDDNPESDLVLLRKGAA